MKRHTFLGLTLSTLLMISTASAGVISSESDPALTGATLINFDAGPVGSWSSQTFSGLTISAPGQSFAVDSDYSGSYNTRGAYHITNHGSSFTSLRFDALAPITAFGFLFGASDVNWILSAFTASNTLIASTTVAPTGSSNSGNYFGLSGLSGADYLTLTSTGGADYVFVDNVRYATDVPEPTSIALLGAALIGFGISRRKRA